MPYETDPDVISSRKPLEELEDLASELDLELDMLAYEYSLHENVDDYHHINDISDRLHVFCWRNNKEYSKILKKGIDT